MTGPSKDQAVAVLTSGGTESAAMTAEALQRYERVYPIYIRKGFIWEQMEMVTLRRFLLSLRADGLARAEVLSVPLQPIYNPHWSLGKSRVPGFKAPDESVYLPGRNLLLLGLGGLFCSIRKIPNLWIGILKGNPFHDARAGFLHQMETVLREAVDFPVRIAAPFRELSKQQVIQRFSGLPWEKTFSCLSPVKRAHCGRCQKCAERIRGFRLAGITDPTPYAK